MGRMTAADKAYRMIRQLIATGALAPGAHLREFEMADRTGLSRTPIREALLRLGSEGWVTVVANRGAFVNAFDRRASEEVFGLRVLLEPFAAELAAQNITGDQLARLRDLNREMADAIAGDPPDLDAVERINNAFHSLIVEAADSRRLASCLASVLQPAIVFRTFSRYRSAELRRSVGHHEELVAALSVGDGTWARAAMVGHLSSARHVYDRQFGSEPGATARR